MRNGYWIVSLAIAMFGIVGCDDTNYQDYKKAPLSEGHDHDHDHDHGHAGKHGGHVLELDDAHGHHAELVFDAATRDITVYFYGAEVGAAHAASDVTLELHEGDAHKPVASKPMPLDGETAETASRWVFAGTDVPAAIKSEEQLDGDLSATMDGKQFVAELEPHSHEHGDAHDDHDHAEHGEAGHKDAEKSETEPKAE